MKLLHNTDASLATGPLVPGMGPIILENAVAFRVWAPHADEVSVIGDFNEWNVDAAPMIREETGCWYAVVEKARPGSQYKYAIRNGESVFQRIDPRAREVTSSIGNGIVHHPDFDWGEDNFAMPPWNQLVIYETHIGTFHRTGRSEVGNFGDFTRTFGHLETLGVNALQIMPIAEFAGDLSWGYNPAHPFAVESAYGGPQGFKMFVREAHRAGFAVILDVVYNHFGPGDLDLWQFDGWSADGQGGIYFYNDHRSNTPWGETRPDYGRSEVRSYIRDNAIMWLDEYHVDGLRFDMTLYIRSVDASAQQEIPDGWGLTQWINREIRHIKPAAITIAEDLQNNAWLTKPEEEGGAGFSTQWDATFVHSVRDVLIQSDDAARDMAKVREALCHEYNADPFQRVIYTESHDEVANGKARIPSEIDVHNADAWHAKKRAALGLTLTLTAPGIPMLFQGQEFLEDGYFQDHEELDWSRADEHEGIIDLTANLIQLRLNREGTTPGLTGPYIDVFHFNLDTKVIAFRRSHNGTADDNTVVIVNFADRHLSQYCVGLPAPGRWQCRFDSDRRQWSRDFQGSASGDVEAIDQPADNCPHQALLELPPYTAIIYSQDASAS